MDRLAEVNGKGPFPLLRIIVRGRANHVRTHSEPDPMLPPKGKVQKPVEVLHRQCSRREIEAEEQVEVPAEIEQHAAERDWYLAGHDQPIELCRHLHGQTL